MRFISVFLARVIKTLRFDKFSSTLAKTTEGQGDGQDGEHTPTVTATTSTEAGKPTTVTAGASPGERSAVITTVRPRSPAGGNIGGSGGADEVGKEDASESTSAPKKPTGREWLRTHPHGTPPTTKLALQFDQVRRRRRLTKGGGGGGGEGGALRSKGKQRFCEACLGGHLDEVEGVRVSTVTISRHWVPYWCGVYRPGP